MNPLESINPFHNGGMMPTLNFYPWIVDHREIIEIVVASFAVVLALYLWLRSGRGYHEQLEEGTEEPVYTYAGIVSQGRSSMPVFLICWMIFLGLWAIGYIADIATQGLRY